MFKIGDIVVFEDSSPGVMEVIGLPVAFNNLYLQVRYIEDHERVNSEYSYLVGRINVTKDKTYYRRKKLKKLMKCLK